MGGHALSSPSVRLSRANFDLIAESCKHKLEVLYPQKRVFVIDSYRSKLDFGDCDILVESGDHYNEIDAANALGAVEVVNNGPVTSIGLIVDPSIKSTKNNMFQVDLIKTNKESFDFSIGYFGAGDAGNLLGRLYHSAGLAFRHDGLFYYFRDQEIPDYKFKEILISESFSDSLKFMGYNPEVYEAGFDTKEDIYKYVASSRFFNKEIFLLQNRNAKSRVRDKKRVMYMEFLNWCENTPNLFSYQYPKDKSCWIPRIIEFFPGFKDDYEKASLDLLRLKKIREKFSGVMISEITGKKGKELGELICEIKNSFSSKLAFNEFILNSSELEIKKYVYKIVENFNK